MDIIEQYPEDVLAYGYFTSDDYTTATLIANSTFAYQKNTPTMYVFHHPPIYTYLTLIDLVSATKKWC